MVVDPEADIVHGTCLSQFPATEECLTGLLWDRARFVGEDFEAFEFVQESSRSGNGSPGAGDSTLSGYAKQVGVESPRLEAVKESSAVGVSTRAGYAKRLGVQASPSRRPRLEAMPENSESDGGSLDARGSSRSGFAKRPESVHHAMGKVLRHSPDQPRSIAGSF